MHSRRASGSNIMASIKRSFPASFQRHRPSFENNNTGHDADALASQPLFLKQQDKKNGFRREHRNKGGNSNSGFPGVGYNDGPGRNSSNMPGHRNKPQDNCDGDTTCLASSSTSVSSPPDAGLASSATNTTSNFTNDPPGAPTSSAFDFTSTAEESTLSNTESPPSPTTSSLYAVSSMTGTSALESGSPSSSSGNSSSSKAVIARHSNKTGTIVGCVLGGLVFFILFVIVTLLWLRRRQRKRTPASAEFRDRYIPRSTAPPMALSAQRSEEYLDYNYDGPPPPFTEGAFNDPLFEKIRETQQDHVRYGLAS